MIVVHFMGGLGNQMFQYALGRRLSISTGAPLVFDIDHYRADPLRSFALHSFETAGRLPTKEEEREITRMKGGRRLSWLSPLFARKTGRVVKERGFRFDPSVLNSKAPLWLFGYWQTEQYFDVVANQVRGDFMLRELMTEPRRRLLEKIESTNSVSIHVRRGDYASNPATNAYHGTCTPSWYAAAVECLERKASVDSYFVFSDEPEWVAANMGKLRNCEIIQSFGDGRDWEDLVLMSRCRHHIIANSSFSWWAAWLNPRPEKIVVAPKLWFRKADIDTSDLCPDSWLRV